MPAKAKAGKLKTSLVVVLSLLIVGLGAGAYMVFNSNAFSGFLSDGKVEDKENSIIVKGASIGGIDFGGMDKEEAVSALKSIEKKLLGEIKISFTAGGKQFDYSAADLGITLDIAATLEKAFGVTEINPEIKPVFSMDTETAKSRLTADSANMNVAPVDAKMELTPDGETKFKIDNEINGQNVIIDDLLSIIGAQVKTCKFELFKAPSEIMQAKVKASDLQLSTNEIVTFTSSFKGSTLGAKNRVHNIAKLAGLINGSMVMPGEKFSLNEKAGPRTIAKGWKKAPGIVDGRYEYQPGGGVCQVSGTLYNVLLRAELEILERKHHSWPSSYLPIGLDATISTGGPDLKFKNQYDAPVYIFAAADEKKKTLTISIYGKPLAHGYKVEYYSKRSHWLAQPASKIILSGVDLEGNPIPEGRKVVYKGHRGQVADVYRQYIDKITGKVVQTTKMYEDRYSTFNERVFSNPEPEPSPSELPSEPLPEPPPETT